MQSVIRSQRQCQVDIGVSGGHDGFQSLSYKAIYIKLQQCLNQSLTKFF